MPGAWEGAWRSVGRGGTKLRVSRCGRMTVSSVHSSTCPLVTTFMLPLAISPASTYAQCSHLGCHKGSNMRGSTFELLHGRERGCSAAAPRRAVGRHSRCPGCQRVVDRQFGPRQQQQGLQLRANKPQAAALFCCHKLVVRARKVDGYDDAPRCRAVEIVVVHGVPQAGSSTNVGQVQAKGGLHRCQTDPHAPTTK